jgi:CBS domain-containing protein
MARTVQEIMNREVLAVRPDLPLSEVRTLLRSFHVGAVPVLDETRHPLGVVSLRDVLEGQDGVANDRMTRPAICVEASTSVDEAARRMARSDMHHLVVVDGTGAAAGMLSSVDLLRAVLGMPARHPDAFPHWDEATSATWTDDWALDDENLERAPDGPGILALVRGNEGDADEVVWVEGCADVRRRLLQLIELPLQQEPPLSRVLALRNLRFRAASVRDEAARTRVVTMLRDRLDHLPPPGST